MEDLRFAIHVEQIKAVSDKTRVRMVRILLRAGTPLCVAELVDILRLPQYAISRALSRLRRVGLVKELRAGKIVYYGIPMESEQRSLMASISDIPPGPTTELDDDRLRWRLSLRKDSACVLTYPNGYTPDEYRSGTDFTKQARPRILVVCVHNTARSQLAEEYLRKEAGSDFVVESAGLEPGTLNPYVVEVLREQGFDISGKQPRSVFDVYQAGHTYEYVITVCSREAEEKCPSFPGPVKRLNWPFPDPSQFIGSREDVLEQTRNLADQIRARVREFMVEYRKERVA